MGNHYEKLELKRILCVRYFSTADIASMTADPVGNNTGPRSSKPNWVSHTAYFPLLLVSSISFSSWSPISLSCPQLYHRYQQNELLSLGTSGSICELLDKNIGVAKSHSWLDWCSGLLVYLEVHGKTGHKPGSTCNGCRAVKRKRHIRGERSRCTPHYCSYYLSLNNFQNWCIL